jgi:hypothetical protein
MSNNREPSGGLLGLLGVGMVVCCGLPLLLGAGIAMSAAGLAMGSGLVVALGVVAAAWAWRGRQRTEHCDVPDVEPSRPGVDHDATTLR